MAAEWFYSKGGQQAGPVTAAQLKEMIGSGALMPNDWAWKQGMAGWVPINQAVELFATSQAVVPPPLPPGPAVASAQVPAVSKKGDSPEQRALAHLTKAERLADKCKFRPAIAEFTAATRLDPSLWKAFLGRGEAYYLEDEHENAIADFTEAIRLNPGCGEAYRERSLVYLVQDNNVRAAADASKAISILPQDAAAFQYRGSAYMNLKDYDKALRDFGKSIALDPTVAGAYRQRGLVYWLQENNSQAIADFTKSLELKPDNDFVAFCRGRAYFDAEMYREAIPDLERGLQLPRSNYHDAILDARTRLAQARQVVSAVGPEAGIGDPAVARQAAQKKAAAQCHAVPVEKRSVSEPEHTVFAGDAPCPKCKTGIWVEWQNTTVAMACPKCGFRFDHAEAITFLSAEKPEENYKADEAAAAVEAVEVLERAKALLARNETASGEADGDESGVEPDPISTICPHCLTMYRARLNMGDTTRCDDCLEDFSVAKHIGQVGGGLLQGLNPLSWFASEKCPQCRSVAVELGKLDNDPQWLAADRVIHGTTYFYLCNQCRITWHRSYSYTL